MENDMLLWFDTSFFDTAQAPLDFVLRGVLNEKEEIGLELIPGYAVKVFQLKCLGCVHFQCWFLIGWNLVDVVST